MQNSALFGSHSPCGVPVDASKKHLRATARTARAAIGKSALDEASRAICQYLKAFFEHSPAPCVFAYLATPEEANIDDFIAWLLAREVPVFVPRRDDFAPLFALDAVELGRWGVREPVAKCASQMADGDSRNEKANPSHILVPGLAFDRQGGRLGFGGGWYDRALARYPQAMKIGVAFDAQIIEAVPLEAHDILMNALVVPTGLVLCEEQNS